MKIDPQLDTSQGVGVFFDDPKVVETGRLLFSLRSELHFTHFMKIK